MQRLLAAALAALVIALCPRRAVADRPFALPLRLDEPAPTLLLRVEQRPRPRLRVCGGIAMIVLGAIGLAGGIAGFWIAENPSEQTPSGSSDPEDLRTFGLVSGSLGLTFFAGGLVLIATDPA